MYGQSLGIGSGSRTEQTISQPPSRGSKRTEESVRREKNEERVAQTHELLAMLLVESEPVRAIDHMSARMAHGGHINEDMPELVRQAANALRSVSGSTKRLRVAPCSWGDCAG